MTPGNFGEDLEIELEKPICGRYLKISSTTMMVLSEIEVYGELPQKGIKSSYSLKSYNDLEIDNATQMVPYLGILEGVSDKEFKPLELLKRKEAAKSVLALVNLKAGETKKCFEDVDENNEYCAYINGALSVGIISPADKFRPDDYVTVSEFYAMILRALGYGEYASVVAEYPTGVMKVASKIELDYGANLNGNEYVNRNSALHILYNALMSSVMDVSYISNKGTTYDFGKDKETVLEKYFNMSLIAGIVSANNASTLNDIIDNSSDSIVIDGKNYNDLTVSAYNAIGRNICFITDADGGNDIMVWWENPDKNRVYEIECEDVESVDKSTIRCYSDKTTSKKSFNITNADILRNSAACSDYVYDLTSFKSDDSYIILIDNDSDGNIDVVNIMQPTVIPLDTIDLGSDSLTVAGKDGANIKIENYDNIDVLINGTQGKRRNLNNSGAVYVYSTSNNKNVLIDGYTTVIEKKVEYVGSDSVTIGGTKYDFSDYYNKNKSKMGKLTVGSVIKCAIGKNGKLVWVYDDGSVKTPEKIGFIAQPVSRKDKKSFRVFTEDSEFVTLKIADRLWVDGVRMDADDVEDNPILISKKFAIYKVNSKNEIIWIDTENYDEANESDSNMLEIGGVSTDCRSHANAIFDGFKMLFPTKSDMKVFVIPYSKGEIMTSAAYEKYYYITKYSDTFSSAGLTLNGNDKFYMQDESGFPLFAARSYSTYDDTTRKYSACSQYAPVMVVTETATALNSNSDIAYKFSGYDLRNGSKVEYCTNGILEKCINTSKIFEDGVSEYINSTTNSDVYLENIEDIKVGDVLKYNVTDNMLTALEKICERNKDIEYRFGAEVGYPHSTYRYLCGTVNSIGNGLITYKGLNGVETRECSNFKFAFSYIKGRNEKIEMISTSKLPLYFKDGQRCVVYLNGGRPVSVIVYD